MYPALTVKSQKETAHKKMRKARKRERTEERKDVSELIVTQVMIS